MSERIAARPRRKPAGLTWNVDDPVPPRMLMVLAAQHAALILILLVYPLVAAAEIGLSPVDTETFISAAIIGLGLTTMLQCWPRGPGSGFLIVHMPNPILMPAAIQAGRLGGLGLVAGMLIIVGVFQVGLARIVKPLRTLLPPEVCGVAVTMLGVSMVHPALNRVLGIQLLNGTGFHGPTLAVSAGTLGAIVLLMIFGNAYTKLFAVPVGVAAGWIVSAFAGLAPADSGARIAEAAIAGLPHIAIPAFAFDWGLVLVFLLGGLITSIDTLGLMLTADRMNDADWRRADMAAASRGIQVDGMGNVIQGLLGGHPSSCSSSNVGVAFATAATARTIGIAAGVVMIAAAFFPKLIVAMTTIPAPVIGAILLYAATYLIVSGMDLIMSRRLSDRRIFVVGLSVILGLTVELVPFVYEGLPTWARPIFEAPISVAAASAVILNLLLRIGIRQTAEIAIPDGGSAFTPVRDFLERQGDLWGARREVIAAAVPAASQVLDAFQENDIASAPMRLRAHFDEMNLDLTIVYDGEPLPAPAPGVAATPDDLLGDRAAVARFLSHFLSHLGDRMVRGREGNLQTLTLRFEN
jgi:xanthine permease XanP